MVNNGRVPLTSMTSLLDGQLLITPAARAVLTAVKVARLTGTIINTPKGGDRGISGYRDLSRQALFLAASHGNVAAARRCNIDPTMKTSVGAVGGQSHGYADRIDLLFNGHSPDTGDVALMKRYGGIQEFGDDDRNHFWIKNPTTKVPESDMNRIVAHFLNRQHLTHGDERLQTSTDVDGLWPTKSKFSLMLQQYGSQQHGWYDPEKFKIDGEAGTRTKWVRTHLFNVLWD